MSLPTRIVELNLPQAIALASTRDTAVRSRRTVALVAPARLRAPTRAAMSLRPMLSM